MTKLKVALIGNPNVGKSTLFNQLTGLKQQIGNYPGTTVEKRHGRYNHQGSLVKLYDFPGTYTIYPKSRDEEVVFEILSQPNHPDYPDKVIVVGHPMQLKRSLLLFEQVRNMGLPTQFVLNRIDEVEKRGLTINKEFLEEFTGSRVIMTNARTAFGIKTLKNAILEDFPIYKSRFRVPANRVEIVDSIQKEFNTPNAYYAWQYLSGQTSRVLSYEQRGFLDSIKKKNKIVPSRLQVLETLQIYKDIEPVVDKTIVKDENAPRSRTDILDSVLTHPVYGYLIFFGLLFLIFQAIYSWSEWPMNLIESTFAGSQDIVSNFLGEGPLTSLIVDGILPGIGGVVIFIPQIAILFFFLLLLQEVGYMSRVVFMMDKWMKPFGLSGKSVVPLMSGVACAIPAIMAARNIENEKERLITILVTPFMTCSARLPVYAIIIALVIPNVSYLGFGLQGLVLMGLYLAGIIAALAFAIIFKKTLKNRFKSYLIIEMPSYQTPQWKNLFIGLWQKVSAFIFGAGKIILALSIILWVLSTWGPSENFSNAEQIVMSKAEAKHWTENQIESNIASQKLEYSLLGQMGKAVEPVFRPLGYDWKISIGVIASFAAREVFVGTMSTIYSLGGDAEDERQIISRMRRETDANGKPVYDLATGTSLLLFYAFAMQCMSTVAIVKKETGTWKWAIIQLLFMSGLAYITAAIAYYLLK